jgi:phenazine biosynthesis protein phzE
MTRQRQPDLLERVLALEPSAFALLHRPSAGARTVDVLAGTTSELASIADVPIGGVRGRAPATASHSALVLLPYRQIAERGFAARDDGAPLIALVPTAQARVPVADVVARIEDAPTVLRDGHFDWDDDRYAEAVRRVVADEIGTGEGANFVIKRSFVADLDGYSPTAALAFFRRLLERERGAYWTFLIHTGNVTLVGASPESHITLDRGRAVMNPISGTYRYPDSGPTLEGIKEFLGDRKETEELYMVVDEELKMMARFCDGGGRVVGPYLKEMARLAHTEYFIEGTTTRDAREILAETMFAPTVTGSPLENATRVIHRHEPGGRGYYSGVAALIGHDADGAQTLDSTILIRTAEIDPRGQVKIGVGATLVRHSDPLAEVEETRAKAAAVLGALEVGGAARFGTHPEVRAALAQRNSGIADFWRLDGPVTTREPRPDLVGLNALVIDAEDTFTAMIDQQLRSLGPTVTVERFDGSSEFNGYDLVVMGPGPGDPRAAHDPKIARLRAAFEVLSSSRQPFMAVCLSHQVLCLMLGLELVRREIPNQGVQREIELFGCRRRVGFYNTFAARCPHDEISVPGVGRVEVCRDPATGEVHALRGPFFASMQFHAESVLTIDGPTIVAAAVQGALGR